MNISPSSPTPGSSGPSNPYDLSVGGEITLAESKPVDIPSRDELKEYERKLRLHRALPHDATRIASACTLFSETRNLWQRSDPSELTKISPANSLSHLAKEIKLLENSASSLKAVLHVAPCFMNPLPVVLRAFASHTFNRLKGTKVDLSSGYATSAIERACYGAKLMAVRAAGVGLELGDQVSGVVGVGGESKLKPDQKGPKLKDRVRPSADEAAARIAEKKAKLLSGHQKAPPPPDEELPDPDLSADQIAYRDERRMQKEILDREQPNDEQKKIFMLKKACPPPYDNKEFREDAVQKAMASCAAWLGFEIQLLMHRKLEISPLFLNVSIDECLKGAIDTPQKKGKEAVEKDLARHARTAGILHDFLKELALEIKSGDAALISRHLSRDERALYEQLIKPPKEDLPPLEIVE